MTKKRMIDSIYAILCLYEDAIDPNQPSTEKDYLTYLNRKYTYFFGRGDEEIASTIKGLEKIGLGIPHRELRPIVFHMIGLVKKEGD